MVHAALLLLMLEAVHADLVSTISLKRSTQNLQLSTSWAGRLPHLMAHSGQSRHCNILVASLIGRFESSTFKPSTTTFQTIHHFSVDVAHGLVLLFGIGARALPLWDSRTRWNNLMGGLTVRLTTGPSGQTNSPHPSSREGHLSTARWSSGFLLSHVILYGFHAAEI